MSFMWDYNKSALEKTEKGRLLLLERAINNGVYLTNTEKLPADEIKALWDKLAIEPGRKKYIHFLLWGT